MGNTAKKHVGTNDPLVASLRVPADFILLSGAVPGRLEKQLGYFGKARFCYFYYHSEADGVIWRDGLSYGFGCGSWRAFFDYVEPLAHKFSVRLGNDRLSYVFVIDRQNSRAYFGPWRSAEELIVSQHRPPVAAEPAPTDHDAALAAKLAQRKEKLDTPVDVEAGVLAPAPFVISPSAPAT